MYISRAAYHEAEGHTLEILASGPALWPPVDLYWWMSVCSLVPSSQTAKEIYLQGAGGRGSYFTLCLLCCSTRTCTHAFACAYTHTHTLGALAYAQCQKLLHTLRKLTAFPFLARTQDGCPIPLSPVNSSLATTCIHIYNFNDFIFVPA